jgi:hypothetical protein
LKFELREDGDRVLNHQDNGGDQMRVSIQIPSTQNGYYMIIDINGSQTIGLSYKETLRFAVAVLNEIGREPLN